MAENLLLGHKNALSKTAYAMIASVEADPNSSQPKEPVETRKITYYELYHEVNRASHALKKMGIKPGDSVVSFAATNCEMLIVFMATVAVGALFSSTPAEFGVSAVVDRYTVIKPKVLFTIDKYRYAGKEHDVSERARQVVEALHGGLTHVVVLGHLSKDRTPAPETLQGYMAGPVVQDWHSFMASGNDCPKEVAFERMPWNHPMWIVFSSGTTGKPKSIFGPSGGVFIMRKLVYTVHLNSDHRDVFLQFATMGWIVWNMHIMWTTIGGTVVAYDGSPFHPQEALWRLVEKYRVTLLGASPRYIQTLHKNKFKPWAGRDLSSLAQIYTTGAPITNTVYEYVKDELRGKVFINNACGGTELGGSALQSNFLMPVYKGELQAPVLGVELIAADAAGKSVVGAEGTMVMSRPFPNMPQFFADDPKRARYLDTYFSDYTHPPMFNMNDGVYINPATRGWTILGRADGVLNPSGVRFGSAELYYIIEKDFGVEIEDSIAVGQKTPDNDERVILFVKTTGNKPLSPDVVKRIKATIAKALSRRHVPGMIVQVPDVPVTASGKKVEPSVKKLVNGVPLSSINSTGVLNPEVYPWYAKWSSANSLHKTARL